MTDSLTDQIALLSPEQRQLLAMRLRQAQATGDAAGTAPRQPVARREGDRLSLSATQEQLWFLDRLEPGSAAYNIPFALRLRGTLDQDALEDAVNMVVGRHEPLRTVFVETEDGPRQVARPSMPIPMPIVDVRPLAQHEREAAAEREAVDHARHAFDITAGPLVAVRLVSMADDDHLLLVTAHHIVFDAASARVFSRDLAALYNQRVTGEPAALPPITVQFADHAADERTRLGDLSRSAHIDYWRGQLRGAPALSTLPPDRARPDVQTHRGSSRELALPEDLTAAVAELARREGVTPNAVVLTGLAAVLRRASGQEDVVLGMPVAGRSRTELEPLIGSFANMLVLRVEVPGDVPVRELIRRCHAQISGAYAHQDVPYTRIVEEVRPHRDPSYNPLFQVMVSLGHGSEDGWSAAGVEFQPVPVESGVTDFDLFISLVQDDGELKGTFQFNADLYFDETAEQVTEQFRTAVREIAAEPGRCLQDIDSLRRGAVTVVSTFTANLVQDPLRFWCDFLRLPFDVELAPYGQVVQHLLAGPASDTTVVLLRWDDVLRHWDGDPSSAGALLDSFDRDLRAAISGFRARSDAPLVVIVCPPGARFQGGEWDREWSLRSDRFALFCGSVTDVFPLWTADWEGLYPVEELHDARADELGHVPYTSEFFSALGTVAARQLWRILGSPSRTVIVEAGQLSFSLPPTSSRSIVQCRPGALLDELAGLVATGALDPTTCVVLHHEPETVAEVRSRHPEIVALAVPPAPHGRHLLDHLWLLDEPAAPAPGLVRMGAQRAAFVAQSLTAPDTVAERARPVLQRQGDDDQTVIAPRTGTEEQLASLWRQALQLEEVGVTQDFFSLGGHSLLVTQVLSRIHATMGRELSLYTFFTHPTIEQLARLLDETADGPGTNPIQPVPRGGELPASSAQERLWALAQMGDGGVRHNTTFAARLLGQLDEGALRNAVAEIVRRHEVLRATFSERRGRPVVIVRDEVDCWMPTVDLATVQDEDRSAAAEKWVRMHATEPYDLAAGPLLRVRLLRLAGNEHYLLAGMHHTVCDNTSWDIFLSELATVYASYATGEPSDLPALPVQFADYAAWQQTELAGETVAADLAYWRDRLDGAPAKLALATDNPRPAVRTDHAGTSSRRFEASVAPSLRALSSAEGVTPFTTLLAAYAALLSAESGETDLVIGVPSAGRGRPELTGVIGCFADILPVRLDLSGRPSFRRLVQRVHRALVEAHRHGAPPFAMIVEALEVPRDRHHHPVFQCVFNFVDAPAQAPTLPGLEIVPLETPTTGVDFDLLLHVSSHGDRLEADLEYSADLFTDEGARRLLAGLGRLLDGALARPDEAIADIAPHSTPGTGPVDQEPPVAVAVASSFGTGAIAGTLSFWSGRLDLPMTTRHLPAGQLLRPLLDANTGFGAAHDGINVALFRWEDWLGSMKEGAGTARSFTEAVLELERRLHDLCAAIDAFRQRSAAPLLLGVCPPSPLFAGAPWTGAFGQLTDRLRRHCGAHDDVSFVLLDAWLHRYGVADPYADRDGLPYGPDFSTVAATVIAREAFRGRIGPIRTIVLDAARLAALDLIAQLTAEQSRCGRTVVVTSVDEGGDALRAVGAVTSGSEGSRVDRLAAAVADAGASGSVVVLDPDPGTLASVADRHPDVVALAVPDRPDELRRFFSHLWLLDPPSASTATRVLPEPRLAATATVLADIAHHLAEAAGIRAAVAPQARRSSNAEGDEPRTDDERTLARIWAELLEVDRVGIHDDFFELGGDSMMAIQAVFHATESGIAMTPRQLVENPTIARLCASPGDDGEAAPGAACEQGVAEGGMPVTAAQRWFLETLAPTMQDPSHFNHPYYLELRQPVEPARLEQAVQLLAAHHDALRLRFQGEGREWWQTYASPEGAVWFESHDLSGLPRAERDEAMERLAAAQQVGLDLAEGPLLRVVHFRLGESQRDRLLVVCHHVVTDGVSRGLLLQDLQTLCLQLSASESPQLPDKTTSYRSWAERLYEYAQSDELRAELAFWSEQAHDGARLPVDFPEGRTTFGTLETVDVTCTEEETKHLRDAARRLRVNVRELLVWAVAGVVTDWTGQSECAIATTGHGREELFDGIDVSRTVGWFQVLYPIRVSLGGTRGNRESVAAVARALDRVPSNGIGYGLLRFACDDDGVREQLAGLPQPDVAVNYMGGFSFDETQQAATLFDVCQAPFGSPQDEGGEWPFRLDLAGSMVANRLKLASNYGTQVYRRETVEGFLDEVRRRLLGLTALRSAPAPQNISTKQTGGTGQWR